MAIDIIARGMIESSKNDISQLFDITKGGEIVNNESSYTLNNAVDYPLLGLNLYGKSTQDGTPTPTSPVEIVSVGDSGTVEITACGKNLYEGSQDWSGTWLNDSFWDAADEKYLGLDVKKKSAAWMGLKKRVYVEKGKTYTFSCYAKADVDISCRIFIILSTDKINKNALPFNYTELFNVGTEWVRYQASYACERTGYILPRIEKVVEDSNYLYVCGYQLEESKTMTDYAPYKGSTSTITSALPLCGIPVDSGGNYTDSDGQQWVCDELIYNADGTGKVVKNTGDLTISASSIPLAVNPYEDSTVQQYNFTVEALNCVSMAKSICNILPYYKGVIAGKNLGHVIYGNKTIVLTLPKKLLSEYGYVFSDSSTYVAACKSYIADNQIQIKYELATPEEIELTAAEMSVLKQLQTYNGVTNISNDSGADMDVKLCTNKMLAEYVFPITTGLQKQIDELKAAVISLGGNV